MRKITAGLFISLDGVVEDPQNWHFPYFNDEMGAAVDSQLATADTLLLGRKTYDIFAGAWPDRAAAGEEDAAMGKALGDARKIVVSNRNLQFSWRNSEQLKGDLVEAVTTLKNEPGVTDIAMSGSVSVVRQLLAAGLLDELHLLVHPIAVRKGMRLFDEGESPFPLRLVPPRPSRPAFVPHLHSGRISSRGHVRGCQSPPISDRITPRRIRQRTVRSSASIAAAQSRSLGRKVLCSVASGTLVAWALVFTAATTRPAASRTGTAMERTPCSSSWSTRHHPRARVLSTSARSRARSTIVRSVSGASVAVSR